MKKGLYLMATPCSESREANKLTVVEESLRTRKNFGWFQEQSVYSISDPPWGNQRVRALVDCKY
jgi:hypothetical protein